MAYRTMTKNMLTPLRHFYNGAHLITHASTDPAETALQQFEAHPAGRCMHLKPGVTATGELPIALLGCDGNNKIPVHLFRASDTYSAAGYAGPSSATENGPSWSAGNTTADRNLMFVGLEGYELATTEFDKTQRPYHVGDYLRAPEHNSGAADTTVDIRTVAGVLTKAGITHGASTIVGIVSSNVPNDEDSTQTPDENPYGEMALSFYTTYRPPIAGLLNGTPVNIGA